MSEDFAARLRRLRHAAGWSQPKLAKTVFVTQSFVSKVETGAEPASPEFARACDDALQAGGELVALVRARPTAGADEVEGWQLVDTLTSTRLSAATVAQMRLAACSYSTRYPQATAADLLVPVRQQLRRVQSALGQALPLDVHREAVRLLGLLAGLAGNLALDLDHRARAAAYFDAGRLAGDQAEDTDLTAWVLATSSLIPHFAGRHGVALTLLDEALQAAGQASSPRRRAWLHALRARAAAGAGDEAEALASLDAASTALAVASQPEETDFFDEPRLLGLAGSTLLELSRHDEARAHLVEALSSRAPGDVKGRALLTLDLAACAAGDRDAEAAEERFGAALDVAAGSVVAPIRARAEQVIADMMALDPGTGERARQRLRALDAAA